MKKQELLQVAINEIGFDYFMQCIKNGATPEDAKKEIMTKEAQNIIAERVEKILKQAD